MTDPAIFLFAGGVHPVTACRVLSMMAWLIDFNKSLIARVNVFSNCKIVLVFF